jgi:hypothetical protein
MARFEPVKGLLSRVAVVEAACGHSHTLARDAEGSLYAWGRGDSGELGLGSLSDRSMPVKLRALPGHVWTAVSAGSYYSAAIAVPGSLPSVSGAQAAAALKAALTARADARGGGAGAAVAVAAAAGGGAGAGGRRGAGGDAELLALARATAERLYADGAGELPPGWDYERTEDGEIYFLMPDTLNADGSVAEEGATVWEDPRENFEYYVTQYAEAARRGVDLRSL